jgi:hypothetical protein
MAKLDLDCKRIYKLYGQQVSVNFSILDKIKAGFDISPKMISETNSWTSFALAELYADCSIYRATGSDDDKQHFRQTEEDLRDWLEEMVKILAPYKQIFHDVEQGKSTDKTTKDKVKNDVEQGLNKGIQKGKKKGPVTTVATVSSISELFNQLERNSDQIAELAEGGQHDIANA